MRSGTKDAALNWLRAFLHTFSLANRNFELSSTNWFLLPVVQWLVQRFWSERLRVRSRRFATFTPSAHVRRQSLPVWPPTLNKIPLPLPFLLAGKDMMFRRKDWKKQNPETGRFALRGFISKDMNCPGWSRTTTVLLIVESTSVNHRVYHSTAFPLAVNQPSVKKANLLFYLTSN